MNLMVYCLLLSLLSTCHLVLSTHDCDQTLPADDEDTLQLYVPTTARLYGYPGSDVRVPVTITNYQDEQLLLMFSFQEAFPVYNLNTFTTHVELVRAVEPEQLMISVNESSKVFVNLHISNYVPLLYRSKVTVIAKRIITNITQTVIRREASFHFTVVELGRSLAPYDVVSPACRGGSTCHMSEVCTDVESDSCDLYTWVSTFEVFDAGSGLAYPKPVWPREASVIKQGFVLGTTEPHQVRVMTSCCYPGVSIQTRDLSGNSLVCQVGEVQATATQWSSSFVLISFILLCITL